MVIPIKYRKAGEAGIATYDFTDIAAGTGTVEYNGVRGATATGATIFYPIIKGMTFEDETDNGVLEDEAGTVGFDTSVFNLPRVIKGDLYLTGEMTGGAQAQFTIQKVDSKGNATNLAPPDAESTTAAQFCIKFVIPETLFKRGDLLRVKTLVTGGGANEGLHINSEDDGGLPPFKIWIPYKIEL